MLNHVSCCIPPVVEQLRPQDMPSDSPHALISFRSQPLVAQILCVEIMHFKGAVVHMRSLVCGHKESVMVCIARTNVDVGEDGDVELLPCFIFDV